VVDREAVEESIDKALRAEDEEYVVDEDDLGAE
jgi:hypothetical protein